MFDLAVSLSLMRTRVACSQQLFPRLMPATPTWGQASWARALGFFVPSPKALSLRLSLVFVRVQREREEALGDELRVCFTNGLYFTKDVTEICQYHLLKEMLLQQEL